MKKKENSYFKQLLNLKKLYLNEKELDEIFVS